MHFLPLTSYLRIDLRRPARVCVLGSWTASRRTPTPPPALHTKKGPVERPAPYSIAQWYCGCCA